MTIPESKIYIADVSPLMSDELFESVYSSSSDIRRRKTDSLKYRKDKNLSLGAEYLLMKACNDFGLRYNKLRFGITENQKPYIKDSGMYFNLSHSNEKVMCIMSQSPAGCDIEHIHPVSYGVAGRFFHESEAEIIDSCSDCAEREKTFIKIWTLKESFIKCTGFGFRIPMNSFSVGFSESGIILRQSATDKNYSIFDFPVDEWYYSAWCIEAENAIFTKPETVTVTAI